MKRKGIEKIMKYYNKNEQKFDLRHTNLPPISDIFIYEVTSTYTTSLPFVNINYSFDSTHNSKLHCIKSHKRGYDAIKENINKIYEKLNEYSKNL